MYYYLKGELVKLEANACVIDCGGVGYKCTVSLTTSSFLSAKSGQTVTLYTHLAVREDGIEMFGFATESERACFNQLTSVSGVGPKAAVSILSYLSPDKFSLAVCTGDAKAIAKAKGIGTKTAERIILELKDKISKDMMGTELSAPAGSAPTVKSPAFTEAAEALLVLGYDKNTVNAVLSKVDGNLTDSGDIIKSALRKLAF